MKRYIYNIGFVLTITFVGLTACTKIPIGYLHTSDAVYTPNSKYAYRQVDTVGLSQKEIADKLDVPFSSTALQGLSGTQPISYSFYSVKVSDGGDEAAFLKTVQEGNLLVRGGYIQLRQRGASQLPVGKYTITIRVANEGHEALLQDAFTFIVKEQPEEGDSDVSVD